jgi:hypothetical protein
MFLQHNFKSVCCGTPKRSRADLINARKVWLYLSPVFFGADAEASQDPDAASALKLNESGTRLAPD